ncbi:hypothetical protein BGZ76_002380 [Entomortierella beljakovae]|nr:hypothetical protein BGZ76_002380 [Entomortierella beljakovae]
MSFRGQCTCCKRQLEDNELQPSSSNEQQASELSGHASQSGAGGCAVAVVGMVAAAAGAVACAVIPPPGEVACLGSGAMIWFAGLFTNTMTMAIYECNSIGQSFTGHASDLRCAVAEFIMANPPPGGVPSDRQQDEIKQQRENQRERESKLYKR